MVRFGEARSRRELVWYGEAGEARCDKAGRYQVWHGPVSHGPVRQVRLVMNRRVAVDTGEAFWGMERQVRYGKVGSSEA